MAERRQSSRGPRSAEPESTLGDFARRELVVITRAEDRVLAMPSGVRSTSGADLEELTNILRAADAQMVPLFGLSEPKMRARAEAAAAEGEPIPDLSVFYRVVAQSERLDDLADALLQLDSVEAAFVKPPAEPAGRTAADIRYEAINDMAPSAAEPPIATPDFTPRQGYLDAAPGGIDARYAWMIPGGAGAGVKIIDCEWGWQLSHEDLTQNALGVLVGTGLSYDADPTADTDANRAVNHGTAVVGVLGGDRNGKGVTGICPDALVGCAAFSKPTALVIREAADKLSAGDILLLEIHRAGPRFNFQLRKDQQGYIAIEWWPDDFAAIGYAVSRGIIVVEAAGNGRENLDDTLYDARPTGFASTWKNPFNSSNPSSGAVLVGAGAPPPGTHTHDHGPDRSRLDFSNYGQRVDCQGWGREVTTTGYGDLQGGLNTNEWYTDAFAGTSSASPIVAGALACVQGTLRAQGSQLLNSTRSISLLRSSGSPQQDAPGRPKTQRIGNRPNLKQIIPAVINGWSNSRTVIRAHARNGSMMAWAVLNGSGWIRVQPASPDGVTNNLLILCEALANGRQVDVLMQDGAIAQAVLR